MYNGGQLSYMGVGSDNLYFSYDASGTPVSLKYNGTVYYYATNLQGDVTAILNSSGAEVVTYTYDAWGKPSAPTGNDANTLGALNPLRYRGYVYDTETGLYYLQSRYYNPTIGRFINADAYASTGQGVLGNNMFAYCGNSPVNRIDNSGTEWKPASSKKEQLQYDGGYAGGGGAIIGLIEAAEILKKSLLAFTEVAAMILASQQAGHGNGGEYIVYVLTDSPGNVYYVGRTMNEDARKSAHKLNPARKDLEFHKVAGNLSYEEARGLEQTLMLYYHTIDKNNAKFNQINGISLRNSAKKYT